MGSCFACSFNSMFSTIIHLGKLYIIQLNRGVSKFDLLLYRNQTFFVYITLPPNQTLPPNRFTVNYFLHISCPDLRNCIECNIPTISAVCTYLLQLPLFICWSGIYDIPHINFVFSSIINHYTYNYTMTVCMQA